jgi:hypothetical protein
MPTGAGEVHAGRRSALVAAAAVAALALLLGVLALATTPRTQGLSGDWETPTLDGTVLGGRALVAADANVAIDLVSGKRITIGSVTGGKRAVGGDRLLILGADRLDGAALDAQQRWTWTAPSGLDLALAATSPTITVVQGCGGSPQTCTLFGVGQTGNTAWTMPQPTSSGTQSPVVGADGTLPRFAVLPAAVGSLNLVDPDSSRVVTRAATSARVDPSVVVILDRENADGCSSVVLASVSDSSATPTAPTCVAVPASLTPQIRAAQTRLRPWYQPIGKGRYAVELSGRHTGRIVDTAPLTVLRVDDTGVTVLAGELLRRYTFDVNTGTMTP